MASRKKPLGRWPPTQNLTKFSEAALSWSPVRRCVWWRAWGVQNLKVLAAPDITILSLRVTHGPQPTLSTRSPHRQSPPLPEASAHPVPVLRVKIARASAARRQGRGREARQTPPCRYAGWHAIRFFGRRGDRPVTPLEPRDANPRARGAALRVGLSAVMSTSGTRVPATPTRTKGCFDMLVARR